MRARSLVAISALHLTVLAVGCTAGAVSSSAVELDVVDRRSEPTVVPPDAGLRAPTLIDVPPAEEVELRTIDQRDCYAPCPGPCAPGESCCGSSQRCVRLDCPSCCADPAFIFDAVRRATQRCCPS